MYSSRLSLFLLTYLFCAGAACAADHYVAPNGTAQGDGSLAKPWDLQTALSQPPSVQPGDTLWLRGGTYQIAIHDGFVSKLAGTAAKPILVRNYHGERATLDGQLNAYALYVGGSYTWYWGLEVMSSCTVRTTGQKYGWCSLGVGVFGPGNKFINMLVHDTAQGFSGFNSAPDTEFYGNLSYYNGFVGSDRNHGHGMYFQNETGSKIVADNFVGDNADEGMQIYGSGNASVVNFVIEGNSLYNNSSWPLPHFQYQYNLIIAGGKIRKNIAVQNNYSYFPAGANVEGWPGSFGQYTVGDDMKVTDNVLANGFAPVVFTGESGPVTFTGNKVVAGTDAMRAVTLDLWPQQNLALYTWDRNTYYDQSPYHFYQGVTMDGANFSGANKLFADWKSQTGFDSHSSYQQAAPTGVWVYVRPNKYEPKRANVTVFNWDLRKTVSVDLSGVLKAGDRYVVQDAQNFYGPAVLTGTYAGKPVSVPMSGLVKAAPVGFSAPAHTAPQFGTFVVLPAGNPASTPGSSGSASQQSSPRASAPPR